MRVDELTLADRRTLVAAWKKVNGRGLPKKSVREALATKGLKRCGCCWRNLEFSEFDKEGKHLRSYCRPCAKAGDAARRANPDGLEARRASYRKWREANREREAERNRQWRKDHPEESWNRDVRRRCENFGVPFEYVTFAELDAIIRRHGWSPEHCFYCWTPLTRENRERDHIIPLSDPKSPGGVLANTVNACRTCNRSKRRGSAEEFVAKQSLRNLNDSV